MRDAWPKFLEWCQECPSNADLAITHAINAELDDPFDTFCEEKVGNVLLVPTKQPCVKLTMLTSVS